MSRGRGWGFKQRRWATGRSIRYGRGGESQNYAGAPPGLDPAAGSGAERSVHESRPRTLKRRSDVLIKDGGERGRGGLAPDVNSALATRGSLVEGTKARVDRGPRAHATKLRALHT